MYIFTDPGPPLRCVNSCPPARLVCALGHQLETFRMVENPMAESILAKDRNQWGQSPGKELTLRQDQEGGLGITAVTFSVFDILISVIRPLRICPELQLHDITRCRRTFSWLGVLRAG